MQLSDRMFARAVTAAIMAICMNACGGGGGGGSPSPVLGSLTFTTNENVALTGGLTATDPGGGQVTFSQAGNPASGTISGFTPAGAFVYTPNPNFTGSDSFAIQATDAAGHQTPGTVMITVTVNKPPTASNTILRADGAALAAINVLQNANDPDKDKLTVTIVDQPPGPAAAVVNTDGTVSLTGLSGFKGLTRFTYQVTDPSGAAAKAAAAIFVGTDPFRAAFVGDAAANGSNEVYLTDFAADPVVMTAATQGNLRLKGFAISDNGATIVYRTEDTSSPATTSLSFVRTASPRQSTGIPLPIGTVPVLAGNKDQFVVSPDGQWIAVIAGQGSLDSLYVVNVTTPTVITQIEPAGAAYATLPTFSLDSKNVYFLASSVPAGAHKSLYYTSLSNPGQTTLISAASDPATSDEVSAYSVSPDQTRILLEANRSGRVGLFFVDAQHPQTEIQVNQPLSFGQSIGSTTVGLPQGRGGSTTVARVGYTIQGGAPSVTPAPGIYVADVATSSNPRPVVQNNASLQVIGLRPDDAAILYTDGAEVSEGVIATSATQAVGGGSAGWYDSTGNILLLQQSVPYTVLASTARGSFGTTQRVGTTSLAEDYNDVSGFDRGVAIIGQGPNSGAPPPTATLEIVSALAPQGLLPLASFQSPLQLTSYSSKVVSK